MIEKILFKLADIALPLLIELIRNKLIRKQGTILDSDTLKMAKAVEAHRELKKMSGLGKEGS